MMNSLKRKSDASDPTQSTPPKRFKVTKSTSPQPEAGPSSDSPFPVALAYTHDPTYYIADGDIIVVSGAILFRIHVDKLVKLGGIFEEMLSLPQPTNGEVEGYIDGVPVCPLFNTSPGDVRFLMAYAYGKILPRKKVQDRADTLHWSAAVALLHLSHMFDLVTVRANVIDALKLVFPCGPEYTLSYSSIAGIKRSDRALFLRLYPLQAINLFRQYSLHALMPMAYYHAAQLAITDIVGGVVCSDGSRVTISGDDVITVLEGREKLRLSRRTVLFRCLNDLTLDQPVTEECSETPTPSGETCPDYLLKMVLDFNQSAFMDSRTDALETLPLAMGNIFSRHLCESCSRALEDQLLSGVYENWLKLPTYFGFKGWEEVVDAQRSEDKRYDD